MGRWGEGGEERCGAEFWSDKSSIIVVETTLLQLDTMHLRWVFK